MGIVKHSQNSQKSKFVMSLQYLKKKVRDEVDFQHADKHQSFLQVDFNTLGIKVSYKVVLSLLMGMIKHSQSTQSNKFAVSLQYLKKKLGMEFIFSMQRNITKFLQVGITVFDGSDQTCPKYLKYEVGKWVQPFRLWNSKICYIYLKNKFMKLAYFSHADTNLGKLNVNLLIIRQVAQKQARPFRS